MLSSARLPAPLRQPLPLPPPPASLRSRAIEAAGSPAGTGGSGGGGGGSASKASSASSSKTVAAARRESSTSRRARVALSLSAIAASRRQVTERTSRSRERVLLACSGGEATAAAANREWVCCWGTSSHRHVRSAFSKQGPTCNKRSGAPCEAAWLVGGQSQSQRRGCRLSVYRERCRQPGTKKAHESLGSVLGYGNTEDLGTDEYTCACATPPPPPSYPAPLAQDAPATNYRSKCHPTTDTISQK